MEIRHLRYFLAVADELHFGRAAARLHMTQPPLSQRIAALERELGLRLFTRDHHKVALTPAGETLVPLARAAVRAFDAVGDGMRAHARVIRAGFPSDTSPGVVNELIAALRRDGRELDWREATTAELQALLVDGTIDLAVMRLPLTQRGLWASVPLRQTLGVVTSADHRFATRNRPIELSELNGQRLLMFRREIAPGLYDAILDACRRGGYHPHEIRHGVRLTDSLMWQSLLTEDGAVMFGVRHRAEPHPGYVWTPLAGDPLWWDTAVFCRQREAPALRTAAQALVTALKVHDHWFEPA
ncbi:LysR family transcriptional regulator [Thermopolyspora sp. NPDC052614]|uniref:LysR family transcriptional regulator n=1 Tax=Thermopolyspora sp. NPDC052614 TaxID=3155682 RepID=UPI0034275D45